MTPKDKLVFGWEQVRENSESYFLSQWEKFQQHANLNNWETWNLPKAYKELLKLCIRPAIKAERIADFAAALLEDFNSDFVAFLRGAEQLDHLTGNPTNTFNLAASVIELGRFHPRLTKHGLRVPTLNPESMKLEFIDLKPESFPKTYPSEDYWHRVPKFWMPQDWGLLISGEDTLLDLTPASAIWDKFPLAEKADDSLAEANLLLDDAYTGKEWVIPPKAIVQLRYGPFSHFEVTELGRRVYFVGRSDKGELAIFSLEPETKFFEFPFLKIIPDRLDRDCLAAGLKLVLAAILRDFWVLERREIAFTSKAAKRLPGGQSAKDENGSRIVYLPRVRYSGRLNASKCAVDLNHTERGPHFVSAHLRKTLGASATQLTLAKQYQIRVPVGFTFVRPHERGGKPRNTVYRSRSALLSLFDGTLEQESGAVQWFQFERDVARLMESFGFSIEHRGLSRSKDHGVDVFATKSTATDSENWIIQCKCYSTHRPVGPSIVRELNGVLATYPPGTKGMIVTTSVFSSGARLKAGELGIRTIDGAEFIALVSRSKNSPT